MRYEDSFLGAADERALLEHIRSLPLAEARYKSWTANRRIVSYGGRYDFDDNVLLPAPPIPPFLEAVKTRAADWAGVAPDDVRQALVAEYRPNTQLGWHRDVPEFEVIIGLSLGAPARMRFRRYPHRPGTRERALVLDLAPRSIYALTGAARWEWQHAISPTKALRYSITFRTLRR